MAETSTLYPKITSKVRDLKRNFDRTTPSSTNHQLELTGTVKLHGTHGDVVFPEPMSDNFVLQSRNMCAVTKQNDNQGYAAFMGEIGSALCALRKRFIARYKDLNPDVLNSAITLHPLVIAGEFVGSGLLRGTAINTLSTRLFVIISVNIAGKWQRDEDYGLLHDESNGIYNISRGGFFHETLNLSPDEPDIEDLNAQMRVVASQCPFAASMGVKGIGEGIVWKPTNYGSRTSWSPDFWLKTKAPEFWESQRIKKIPGEKESNNKERGALFAQQVTPERRLKHGLEWMEEMGHTTTTQNINKYLDWLWKDIKSEEGEEIRELRIPESWVKTAASRIGAQWYKSRIELMAT